MLQKARCWGEKSEGSVSVRRRPSDRDEITEMHDQGKPCFSERDSQTELWQQAETDEQQEPHSDLPAFTFNWFFNKHFIESTHVDVS